MNFQFKKIANQVFALLSIGLFFSCGSSSKISNQNLSYSYKKSESILNPQFAIQHISDTLSTVHFAINTSELLYVRTGESNAFTARVALTYRLLASYDSKQSIDTGSVVMYDKNYSDVPNLLIGKANFKARMTNNYVLEILLQDLNRNISIKSFLNVYKTSTQSAQNFIVTDTAYNQPVFRNFLKENETVNIRCNNTQQQQQLFVRFYNRQFPLPPPSFASYTPKPFDYKADSIFTIPLGADGVAQFKFEKIGFYHLQFDTIDKEGLTLFRFSDEFPYLTQADQLVPVLRYITTKQEFEDLNNSSNKKIAIDEFWQRNAGSNDRARNLIKVYYTRAQEANVYFTSYCEGWRTDRGLIYTLYGQPNTLYKQENMETWVYGEDASYKSLSFVFVKVINPFTENDYQLNRSDMFKDEWYKSVDAWRQGRAYNDR